MTDDYEVFVADDGERAIRPVADPIDTEAMRDLADGSGSSANRDEMGGWLYESATEVDRLRAENTALAAALEDIAGIASELGEPFTSYAECSMFDLICHEVHEDDPDEWCAVCVAEVAWCAWKMGVLG